MSYHFNQASLTHVVGKYFDMQVASWPPGRARLQVVGGVDPRVRRDRGDRPRKPNGLEHALFERVLPAAPRRSARRSARPPHHVPPLPGTSPIYIIAPGLRMPTAGPEPRCARPDLLNE